MFYVYLIACKQDKLTYVGATTDVFRRLSQHNSLRAGGAKRTTKMSQTGEHQWELVCYVQGFPTWKCALQFEWRWKQLTRRLCLYDKMTALEKRKMALEELLSLPQSTTKAIPFAEYKTECKVIDCRDQT